MSGRARPGEEVVLGGSAKFFHGSVRIATPPPPPAWLLSLKAKLIS